MSPMISGARPGNEMVKREAPMNLAVKHVQEQLDVTGDLLSALESRLAAYQSPLDPANAVGVAPRPVSGPVANTVADIGDKILMLNNRLRVILESLDL